MLNTARRNIPYPNPDRSDRPDIPAHIYDVAQFVDEDVIYTQDTDANRLAAAHQINGGKFWWTTDTGLMWYDDGAAWHLVNTPADGSVTTAKLADSSVTSAKIVDGTIVAVDLAASLKPSGTAVDATEALRAIGTAAGTVMAGTPALITVSDQAANTIVFRARETGDTQYRFTIDNTGTHKWGVGGTTAPDATLSYGSIAGYLVIAQPTANHGAQLHFAEQYAGIGEGSRQTHLYNNCYLLPDNSNWALTSPSSGLSAWLLQMGGTANDQFSLSRAPNTAGTPVFSQVLNLSSDGQLTLPATNANVRIGSGISNNGNRSLIFQDASVLPGAIAGGGGAIYTGSNVLYFRAAGNIVAVATSSPSDERLKTDIRLLDDVIDPLSKLRAVKHKFIHGVDDNDHIGLIAQEVEKYWPEVIYEGHFDDERPDEMFKAIKYEMLVPVLVRAIQQQQEQINSLMERVNV